MCIFITHIGQHFLKDSIDSISISGHIFLDILPYFYDGVWMERPFVLLGI